MTKKFTPRHFMNFQKSMVAQANKKGICENFGQKELERLKAKYPCDFYSDNEIEKQNKGCFIFLNNWLANFNLDMLNKWNNN